MTPTTGSAPAPNDAIGSVEILLGGQAHKLKFSWRAFELTEQLTGRGFLSAEVGKAGFMTSFGQIKIAMWAGLQEDWPGVTIEEVEALLDSRELDYYIKTVSEAIALGLPEQAKGRKKASPPNPKPN